ncbi:hypothetical protein D9M73_192420 [compost metagenome]
MQETERLACRLSQATPVGAYGFQQAEGADDVGFDEVFRAVDRAIDVGLGGEVDDGAWLVLLEQTCDQLSVADVAVHEDVALVALQAAQGLQVACVGEFVEVDHGLVRAGQPVQDEVGADETCAACYQNSHKLASAFMDFLSGLWISAACQVDQAAKNLSS